MPSEPGSSRFARRTTTIIGSRRSVLPLSASSSCMPLTPQLGKPWGAAWPSFLRRTITRVFVCSKRLKWRAGVPVSLQAIGRFAVPGNLAQPRWVRSCVLFVLASNNRVKTLVPFGADRVGVGTVRGGVPAAASSIPKEKLLIGLVCFVDVLGEAGNAGEEEQIENEFGVRVRQAVGDQHEDAQNAGMDEVAAEGRGDRAGSIV
jgi:hypothetical protein